MGTMDNQGLGRVERHYQSVPSPVVETERFSAGTQRSTHNAGRDHGAKCGSEFSGSDGHIVDLCREIS